MDDIMNQGVVGALAFGKAKAKTQEEWAKDLERIWDRSTGMLLKQKGFRGLRAFWAVDGSRDTMVMGIWETMEDRMAYERSISPGVQGAFDEILEAPARRQKFVLVRRTVN